MLSSSLMFRRFCCFSATAISPAAKKKQLVFLGSPQVHINPIPTPSLSPCLIMLCMWGSIILVITNDTGGVLLMQVSASVLDALFNASSAPDSLFEVLLNHSIDSPVMFSMRLSWFVPLFFFWGVKYHDVNYICYWKDEFWMLRTVYLQLC